MMARRVGFVLTPSRRSSASGWIAPATSQKAAPDGSDGTVSAIAAGSDRAVEADGVGAVGPGRLLDGDAPRAEHPLGVVAGRDRLGHRGLARRPRGPRAGPRT